MVKKFFHQTLYLGFSPIRNQLISILIVILLAGCVGSSKTNTPTSSVTSSLGPEPTTILEELGSETNPLVLGIVGNIENKDSEINQELMMRFLEETQSYLEIRYYTDYSSLLLDMRIGAAQIAVLPPATYIFLHDLGAADVSLLTNHFGVYYIGTQIVSNIDCGFTSFFDPVSEKNTAEISRVLDQFEDTRPCWVNVNSLSGYLVPLGLFIQNDIPIQDGVYAQNHTSVIRTLYIRGVCDFGATFALSGDPRTSSAVLEDLTDALDQVIVIYRTEGIIPNNNLSYSPFISTDLRSRLDTFFINLVKTEQGRTLISEVTNYEIHGLMKVDDSVYNQLRELLDLTGVDISTLIGW